MKKYPRAKALLGTIALIVGLGALAFAMFGWLQSSNPFLNTYIRYICIIGSIGAMINGSLMINENIHVRKLSMHNTPITQNSGITFSAHFPDIKQQLNSQPDNESAPERAPFPTTTASPSPTPMQALENEVETQKIDENQQTKALANDLPILLKTLEAEEKSLLEEQANLTSIHEQLTQRIKDEICLKEAKISELKQQIPELKQDCEKLANALGIASDGASQNAKTSKNKLGEVGSNNGQP